MPGARLPTSRSDRCCTRAAPTCEHRGRDSRRAWPRTFDRGPVARTRTAGPRFAVAPAVLRSTRQRMRCKRRSSRRHNSGKRKVCARNPRGWLVSVARRRLTDELRSVSAAKRREIDLANRGPADVLVAPSPADDSLSPGDDTLTLLFLCCHPRSRGRHSWRSRCPPVGGLTTAESLGSSCPKLPWASASAEPSSAYVKQEVVWCCRPATNVESTRGRPSCAVSPFQRGIYHVRRYRSCARRPHDRSDPPDAGPVRHALPDDGEVQGLLALMSDERRRVAPHARRPTARSYRSQSKTGPSGTRPPSKKVWPSSPMRWPALDWGRTNCRPRSPRCTPRHRRRRKPTGRRSCASTNCCRASRRTPWSRSTTRSRSQLPKAPAPDST